METKQQGLFGTSLVGLAVCSFAFFMGFAVLRENRLAKGIPVQLWSAAGPEYLTILITVLVLIAGALILRRSFPGMPLVLAGLGNLFIVLTFTALSAATKNLLSGAADFSRVSLGSGAWVLLLGGYIITAAAAREIGQPVLRYFFSFLFIIILFIMGTTGMFNRLSIIQEFLVKKDRFTREFLNHLSIAFSSVGLAMIIGIPLGILAYRKKRAEKPVFYSVNTAQTIPSLALFGLLIAPLSFLSTRFPVLRSMGIRGIGTTPALIALTLYALLPVTRNTYTSLKVVDPAVIQAGKGMGLSRVQLLFTIEIPMAAPILLNGLRLAAVQAIGNTAIAALIGAGGFGFFIFQGLGQAAADLILLGAIPVVLLAVFVDRIMQLIIRLFTPEGLRLLKQDEGGAR